MLAFLFPTLGVAKDDIGLARENLKKWGFAYCIHQHLPENAADFGMAQNAYFQLGGHSNGRAYTNVKVYVDNAYRGSVEVSAITGEPIVFVRCLQIYESKEFKKLIAAQDQYVS